MKPLNVILLGVFVVSAAGSAAYFRFADDSEKDIVSEPAEWAKSALPEPALMEKPDPDPASGSTDSRVPEDSDRRTDEPDSDADFIAVPAQSGLPDRSRREETATPESVSRIVTAALNEIRFRGESGDYIAALQEILLNDVEADRLDEEASRQLDELLETGMKEGRFPASYFDALDSVVCTTALCEVTFDLDEDVSFFGIGRGLQAVLKQGEFDFAVISSGPHPDDESLFVSYVVRPGMIDFVEQQADESWTFRKEQ